MQREKVIKRYHIPSLEGVGEDNLHLSNGQIIPLTNEIACNLSLDQPKDIHSIPLIQNIVPGPWAIENHPDFEFNKLYHSPFSPNVVRNGDVIGFVHHEQGVSREEAALYLGSGKYMIKKEGLNSLVVPTSLLECFYPNNQRSILRNFHIKYSEEFRLFYMDLLEEKSTQLHTDKIESEAYPFKGTQRLYDTFVQELSWVFADFGEEEGKIVVDELNQRKVIAPIGGGLSLHQNRNSNVFYRDANYSFSIVDDQTGQEVAIMSFLPNKNKEIEIVQIGGRGDADTDFMPLWTGIMDHMKDFFQDLGFEKLKVLRGDKNIGYIHPKQRSLPEDFDLVRHQETMKLRYNVTPPRKRGFEKPGEWYSEFEL